MTALVVDASVAVKWFIFEDGSSTAHALLASAHDLLAPEFLLVELANVLWKHVRRGEMSQDTARSALVDASQMLTGLTDTNRLLASAQTLSFRYDHPIYDCLYLALAMETDAHMVTADARLINKFVGTALAPVLTPLGEFSNG